MMSDLVYSGKTSLSFDNKVSLHWATNWEKIDDYTISYRTNLTALKPDIVVEIDIMPYVTSEQCFLLTNDGDHDFKLMILNRVSFHSQIIKSHTTEPIVIQPYEKE